MSWGFYETGHARAVREKLKKFQPTYDIDQATAAKELALSELSHLHADQAVKVSMSGSISRYNDRESRQLAIEIVPVSGFLLNEPEIADPPEAA